MEACARLSAGWSETMQAPKGRTELQRAAGAAAAPNPPLFAVHSLVVCSMLLHHGCAAGRAPPAPPRAPPGCARSLPQLRALSHPKEQRGGLQGGDEGHIHGLGAEPLAGLLQTQSWTPARVHGAHPRASPAQQYRLWAGGSNAPCKA